MRTPTEVTEEARQNLAYLEICNDADRPVLPGGANCQIITQRHKAFAWILDPKRPSWRPSPA